LASRIAAFTIGKPKYAEYNDKMVLIFEETKAGNKNLPKFILKDIHLVVKAFSK